MLSGRGLRRSPPPRASPSKTSSLRSTRSARTPIFRRRSVCLFSTTIVSKSDGQAAPRPTVASHQKGGYATLTGKQENLDVSSQCVSTREIARLGNGRDVSDLCPIHGNPSTGQYETNGGDGRYETNSDCLRYRDRRSGERGKSQDHRQSWSNPRDQNASHENGISCRVVSRSLEGQSG